jgi:uncharacterized protein (TIGR01244 family)
MFCREVQMTPFRVFLLSVVLTASVVVGKAAYDQRSSRNAQAAVQKLQPILLAPGVAVRDQIVLADLAALKSQSYRTVIDLRPDGEAPDQVPSHAVATAAKAAGLRFAYIPTPHGEVPQSVVDDLTRTLAASDHPVVLYCRSGNRAARVWALAEAGRTGGGDAATIVASVRRAGQKVDDLIPQIEARVAARKAS